MAKGGMMRFLCLATLIWVRQIAMAQETATYEESFSDPVATRKTSTDATSDHTAVKDTHNANQLHGGSTFSSRLLGLFNNVVFKGTANQRNGGNGQQGRDDPRGRAPKSFRDSAGFRNQRSSRSGGNSFRNHQTSNRNHGRRYPNGGGIIGLNFFEQNTRTNDQRKRKPSPAPIESPIGLPVSSPIGEPISSPVSSPIAQPTRPEPTPQPSAPLPTAPPPTETPPTVPVPTVSDPPFSPSAPVVGDPASPIAPSPVASP